MTNCRRRIAAVLLLGVTIPTMLHAANDRIRVLDPKSKLVDMSPNFQGHTPEASSPPEVERGLPEISLEFPIRAVAPSKFFAFTIKSYDEPQIIPPNAFLEYDIFFPADAISFRGGLDLESRPRFFMLRGDQPPALDQKGLTSHPACDLRHQARGTWYRRRFDLSHAAGKPFQEVYLSGHPFPSAVGTYKVKYRRMRIVNADGDIYWNLYPELGDLRSPVPTSAPQPSRVSAQEMIGVDVVPSNYRVASGDPLSLDTVARNFDNSTSQSARVDVHLIGPDGRDIEVGRDIRLYLEPGETGTLTMVPPADLPTGHYTPRATFRLGGKEAVCDSQPFTIAETASPLPPVGDMLGKDRIAWGADIIGFTGLNTLADLRKQGGNFANIFVSWSDIEVQPGVYDFSGVDGMLAAAAKAHLRAELFFIDFHTEPAWFDDEGMMDHNGKRFKSGYAPSYWAPRARPAYMKMLEAVVKRYRDNPTVAAYSFAFGGMGDGFYYGPKDGTLRLYDYSEHSQAAFRRYVRDVLKLTLEQAAQRYGLKLQSWDELKQPVPKEGINLDPIWWDFQNYRVWTVEGMLDEVCRTVRKHDQKRQIELDYGGGVTAIGIIGNDYDAGARICRKYGASIHNTCYEGPDNGAFLHTYGLEWGFPHTFETAGTPARYPRHQGAMFNLLKYGVKGYYWIAGGNIAGIYGSYGPLREVARELADATPVGPAVGVLSSFSYRQCAFRGRDKGIFTSMLAREIGLPVRYYSDRSFLHGERDLDPTAMPVLVDSGLPVLARAAAEAAADYVRRGGTLVIFPTSGRHTPGKPAEEYYLRQALGCGDTPGTTKLGKGRVVMLPDQPDKVTAEALAKLLAQYSVTPLATAINGVWTATLQKDQTQYIVLHNPGDRQVQTTVKTAAPEESRSLFGLLSGSRGPQSRRAYNLLKRTALGVFTRKGLYADGIPVTLAPYETTALALDPAKGNERVFPAPDFPLVNGAAPAIKKKITDSFQPLTDWRLLTVMTAPDGKGHPINFTPEEEIKLVAGVEAGNPVQADGLTLDLTKHTKYHKDGVAYVETVIDVKQDETARLRLTFDYWLTLWLDGKPLFTTGTASHGNPALTHIYLDVPMTVGRHRLTAKVVPGSGGWNIGIARHQP